MPVSPAAKEKIVAGLGRITPITACGMFGGMGLCSEGPFFGLIDDDILYFQVDDSNPGEYEKEGMGPFSPYGPGGGAMQYYRAPDAALGKVRKLKGLFASSRAG